MRILKGADEGRSLLSVSRIRDFLRIPYLYTIPDDYTPGDESYKDDPDYLEDDKVDKELSIIGDQALDFIARSTGFTINGVFMQYEFNNKDIQDGIVKIYNNPITEALHLSNLDTGESVEGLLERLDEDFCYKFPDMPVGNYLMLLRIGQPSHVDTMYRSGDRFFRDETKGIPYTYPIGLFGAPSVAYRLYEIIVDHFYQNRGIVQIGTIVTKMPTSMDTLMESVSALVPHINVTDNLTFTT